MSTTISEVTTSNPGRVLRPRPSTKSSIRQTLNLASMGKALADVMHKDAKDTHAEKEKVTRKTKDVSSKRGSLIPTVPPPANEKDTKGISRERNSSPEGKAIQKGTQRLSGLPKVSETGATSSEESSSPAAINQKAALGRAKTLRPRNSASNVSALPKYRPRSVIIESTTANKPPSPLRIGIRRKFSSSDDEKEEKGKPSLRLNVTPTAADSRRRAISPLPHRGALQVNLSNAINVRPATPDKKTKAKPSTSQSSPMRMRSSPLRTSPTKPPTKLKKPSKAAETLSSTPVQLPSRPPSSASSSSSSHAAPSPTTPSSVRNYTKAQRSTPKASSAMGIPKAVHKRSPLANLFAPQDGPPFTGSSARRRALSSSPSPLRVADTSLISNTPMILAEGNSVDSIDAQDVEFMLSSIASPTAPTPALPRIQTSFLNNEAGPETPSRSQLPARPNASHISVSRPGIDDSPFLRVRGRPPSTNDRSSILTWDQFAAHNAFIGAEEVENMLSVDAPFNPTALSPALTSLAELPESPSLSAMPSPTGYGSISQVLLPDVTPLPAIHNNALRFEEYAVETPPADGAAVTMLKLQLVSLENTAMERLVKIEYLESQLQSARDQRRRDAEELEKQVSELEEQLQASLRPEEQLTQQIASLEEQLRHAQAVQKQAVEEALKKVQAETSESRTTALRVQHARWDAAAIACETKAAWRAVRDTAEGELELIHSNREMLAVLLAGLDEFSQVL